MGKKILRTFNILSLILGWGGVLLVFIDIFYPLGEQRLDKDFYILIGILLWFWFFGTEVIIFIKSKIENHFNELNISNMIKKHIKEELEKNITLLVKDENIIEKIAKSKFLIERISGAIALADNPDLEDNHENWNSLITQGIIELNKNDKSFSLDDLYNKIKDGIQNKYPDNINPKATLRGIFYRDFLDAKKVIRKERWKYILRK